MALEVNPARGPLIADLPTIPQEFINPKTGMADFWDAEEYEAAKKAADESGEPFVAPEMRSGSPIDVRECLACGASVLPTEWPDKTPAPEASAQPKAAVDDSEDDPVEDMSQLTVAELKTIARDAGVRGFSTMSKTELLEAIRE